MSKLKTAAELVPTLVTDALLPAAPVVVVPAVIVAAVPVLPVLPRGMVKLKTAAEFVPTLVTDALPPAAPVVVVPAVIVAAVPVLPLGKVRCSSCDGLEPVILAAAGTLVSAVVTLPIFKTLAGPVGPVGPFNDI
jgi:hypothetical protein